MRTLLVAVMLLTPSALAAQTCPPFTERAAQVIDLLVPRYPGGAPGGTEDQRRDLTRAILEQLVFESPGEGWTWKSADRNRPPSKDALSRLVDGRLCNWDWQDGARRTRQVQVGQIGEDITGQNPIPVAGVQHLAVGAPPTTPGAPPAQGVDLSGVLRRLDALLEDLGVPPGDSLHGQAERMFAERLAQFAQINAKLDALDKKTDGGRNPVMATVGNRWVQLASGVAAAYFTARQMEKGN